VLPAPTQSESTETLGALLVEDDVLLATLLQEIVSGQPGVRLVGTAVSADQALEAARELHPDLILLDIGLPDRSGLDVLKELTQQYPEIRVLMLTLADDMDSVLAAFRAGAIGYIPKRTALHSLAPAIAAVRNGQAWIDPDMSLDIVRELQRVSAALEAARVARDPLTERERQVATMVARGGSDDEIARELRLSPHTVRVHIKRIRRKLGVPNRAALAAYIAREKR